MQDKKRNSSYIEGDIYERLLFYSLKQNLNFFCFEKDFSNFGKI